MSKRREYSPEFKREAVELSRTPGVTVAQIAEELGIGANMLSRWRREQAAAGEKAFQGHGKARDEEMARGLGIRGEKRPFGLCRDRASERHAQYGHGEGAGRHINGTGRRG